MGTSAVVSAAREALGPAGPALPVSFTSTPAADVLRDAAVRLERAGYRAAWTNEVLGKDAFTQLGVLLAATDRMAFGTSITNIWVREPATANAAAALLAQAYPGRFVLGLGVGYPEQAAAVGREFGQPLATMRDYVTRMAAQTWPPAPDTAYPKIIAANGPKMLSLAAEIADGALPAGLPPEYTTLARQAIGPDKLLVTAISVLLDDDIDRAREHLATALGRPSHVATLRRLGYSERDITEVSDRLVAASVAYGDPAAVVAKVAEHIAAGADHVCLLLPIGIDHETGIAQLERLAPALWSTVD